MTPREKMCYVYSDNDLSSDVHVDFEGDKNRDNCWVIVFGCQVQRSFSMLGKRGGKNWLHSLCTLQRVLM